MSVKFTSDEEVRALNAQWRGKDKPTNVLSFPMAEESELAGAQLLGDVVLAHGVCAAEAADNRVPIETHAAHLVYGTLHLLGLRLRNERGGRRRGDGTSGGGRLAAIGIADPYTGQRCNPNPMEDDSPSAHDDGILERS